jgi:hypothetical protein
MLEKPLVRRSPATTPRGFSALPLSRRPRRHLVNATSACNDCHTNPSYAPGGNPFLDEPKVVNSTNYLAGGTAFGPFVSRNITPDASGKPGGLTFEKFVDVMRGGEDEDQIPPHFPSDANDLLQVMPWPVYGDMTDRDLRAIYEYLRAIPHAEPATPPGP